VKKRFIIFFAALCLLSGCGGEGSAQEETVVAAFQQISQEEAKTIMSTNQNAVVLDVRTQEEYETGYIPGAILIPHDKIEEQAAEKLPNKDQLILVYCQRGNRSKTASKTLEKLGYTRIREFGGINDWPYEKEALR
jgi:rhodanese-related sulfurtransferase